MNISLSSDLIISHLPTSHPFTLHLFPTLPSTNDLAKKLAAEGAAEGTVIIANSQTAGRGRLTRSFYSPDETGLYMSLLLRPNLAPEDSLLITTAAATAVAEAIEEVSGKDTWIKWVNDIYMDHRKVCGILTEAGFASHGKSLDYAVLGIGINIQPPKEGFPSDIQNIAGSVFNAPVNADIFATLTAQVLIHFWSYYHHLTDKSFLPQYRRRSMLTGKNIHIHPHGKNPIPATVLEIEDDFSLLVKLTNGEIHSLSSGEVSVRL